MALDRDTIIDTIYAAIGDDAAYARAVEQIADWLGATSGWALAENNGGLLIEQMCRFDPSYLPQYEAYFWQHDLWWQAHAQMPLGIAVSFERFVPTSIFGESEFYHDMLRRYGDQMHGIGFQGSEPGKPFILTIHRTSKGEPFDRQAEERLQSLVPHLQRMAATRRRLAAHSLDHRLADIALESIGDAIFLCDRRGQVIYHRAGEGHIAAKVLAVSAAGYLSLAYESDNKRLARAIREAITPGVSTAMLVERAEKLPLRVTVDPVPEGPCCAIVTVRDHEALLGIQLERARAAYNLTPSETALVENLCRNLTIEQHAAARDTSVATARMQLRAALAKTGTARQAQLVALIGRC